MSSATVRKAVPWFPCTVVFRYCRVALRLRWLAAAGIGCAPVAAVADGGAPLLLLGGFALFTVGQVWIVASESLVLRLLAPKLRWRHVLGDVALANFWSLLLVGVALPALASAGGLALGWGLARGSPRLVGGAGEVLATWSMALTGWVFDSSIVARLYPFQFFAWLIVSYFLSVFVEARVLGRRWKARGEVLAITPPTASWLVNLVSYLALAAVLAWVVVRLR